jgi:hypothetical protein
LTIETRTAIEPQDIVGIGVECKECGYRCTIPADKFLGIPATCPNCLRSWQAIQEEFDRIARLMASLRIFARQEQTSVVIRFEIANPQPNK